MMRLSPDQLAAVKAENPIAPMIERRVRLGRANARGVRSGACICEPARGKSPLWVNDDRRTWGCLKGGCGGDVFSFLEQFEGLDFSAALRSLRGADVPRDEAEIGRLRGERENREAERAEREAALVEGERRRAYRIFRNAAPAGGTLVDAYFRHRGLEPLASKSLRFSPDEPFFDIPDDEGAKPVVIHRGPCMVAAITRADGRFGGVHRTWLDPRLGTAAIASGASGKAHVCRPDGTPAKPKKMRGVKQGGAIRLNEPSAGAIHVILLCGEGIETTATALQACQRHGAAAAYVGWAAGDLGNLAGGGLGPSTPHPHKPGRWIPAEDPDPSAPGVMPPEWASLTVLLGDGDSDPLVTRARLECARRRYEAARRRAVIAMAPERLDFNDLARRGAA